MLDTKNSELSRALDEVERLRGHLAVANELIQWHEATIERLEVEIDTLKLPLKKLVRVWRFGDSDESLLEEAEEIVKDAENALATKTGAPLDGSTRD